MINIKKKKDCCGCGACEAICPKTCISLIKDKDGFMYPMVQEDVCTDCKACEKVCPIINPHIKQGTMCKLYACASNFENERYHSSSGGVFHLIASSILKAGGCVFGVILSPDCRSAYFTKIQSDNELIPALGSKYIQAHMEKIYKVVKQELMAGEKVLFSGTPCHISALKNYLNKEYDNLYSVDLSCHGVPSEKAWNCYLDCREKETGGSVIAACFRSKESGWKDFSVSTDFSNGVHHAETFTVDSYGKAFTQRLLFRPSCENCKFKGLNRCSDLTLGDFWGINEITDFFNDDKGTSLVIAHTEKGMELLKLAQTQLKTLEVTKEQGTRRNPYIFRSVIPHSNKEAFFQSLGNEDFDDLVEMYATNEFVFKDFLFDLKRYIRRKMVRR